MAVMPRWVISCLEDAAQVSGGGSLACADWSQESATVRCCLGSLVSVWASAGVGDAVLIIVER